MPDPIPTMNQDRIVAELYEIYPEFTIFTSHYDRTESELGRGRCVELTLENGLQVASFQVLSGNTFSKIGLDVPIIMKLYSSI